ncbi:hypothetical protein L596_022508 [Steinernema carpocapsae]|uniref:Uncharacterized protein n=1 Tax=Steinernema carpocapsae TaxID=34508 RepID=A0A4V6A094_STECR|nr:hypothetical protein L596_022508 [Steinernema carpocapsae]
MLHYQQQLDYEPHSPNFESAQPAKMTIREAMSPVPSATTRRFARFSSSTPPAAPPAENHSSVSPNSTEHFSFTGTHTMDAKAPLGTPQEMVPPHTPTCDHMQPEEEWDREGLLDPIWEQQQKKGWDQGDSQLSQHTSKVFPN